MCLRLPFSWLWKMLLEGFKGGPVLWCAVRFRTSVEALFSSALSAWASGEPGECMHTRRCFLWLFMEVCMECLRLFQFSEVVCVNHHVPCDRVRVDSTRRAREDVVCAYVWSLGGLPQEARRHGTTSVFVVWSVLFVRKRSGVWGQ